MKYTAKNYDFMHFNIN